MPELGEVRRGREIGKTQERFAYIWAACKVCGKQRWVVLTKGHPAHQYCFLCAQKAKGLAHRRENNGHWKGGRRMSRGYVMIYCPDHSRAPKYGYIPEHILIWEQEHGCPVPEGHVIHHLNGIKTDNRPENLAAISKRKHESYTFIHALQARIREVETIMENIKVQSKQGS